MPNSFTVVIVRATVGLSCVISWLFDLPCTDLSAASESMAHDKTCNRPMNNKESTLSLALTGLVAQHSCQGLSVVSSTRFLQGTGAA